MTKITIISGFLGAGKTTLIKKLLNGPLRREKTALIENDYGDINIDGTFLAETGIEMREIMSGCICCTLAGDFSAALLELKETYQPDRILIEPSGVGKLSDVIRTVETVTADSTNDMEIFSTLTVVDVTIFDMIYDNFGDFYRDQIASAGSVYITHIDDEECTPDLLKEAVDGIREINPRAAVISTPVDALGADAFLDIIDGRTGRLNQFVRISFGGLTASPAPAGQALAGLDDVPSDGPFMTWSSETTRPFSKKELESILSALLDDKTVGQVLRAKGVVPALTETGEEAAGLWYHFDLTPGRFEVRTGSPGPIGQICVIGAGLDKARAAELFSGACPL